jgi:hypothetical protein
MNLLNKTIILHTNLISLLEVLNKTGNPDLAAEILSGEYKEPDIPFLDNAFIEFKSYDKWTNSVYYIDKKEEEEGRDKTKHCNLKKWLMFVEHYKKKA